MPPARLLHIADVHLGVMAHALGERADDLRQRIQNAFESVLALSVEYGCDAVLISGDLFDSNRVGQRTLSAAVAALRRTLAASADIRIFVIPGNHDCLGDGSVYNSPEFRALGDRFHLATSADGESYRLAASGTAIHMVPFLCDFRSQAMHPLELVSPDPDAAHNVAMVHAGVSTPPWDDPKVPSVTTGELAGCGMDYVALGHFHNFPIGGTGDVVAVYPGTPELIGLRDVAGGAMLVEMDDAGVRTRLLRVNELQLVRSGLLGTELGSTAELVSRLQEHAGVAVVLMAEVIGALPADAELDIQVATEALAGSFYHLEIEDSTQALGMAAELDKYPNELVMGRFVSLMKERMEQARSADDDRAARIAHQALRLGVHLLRGGDLR